MPGEPPAPGYTPPPAAPQYEAPGAPPPGGAYPPSGGGYPPPGPPPGGAFPPPSGTHYGAGGVPAGYANNDEKTWALVAHFGGAAGAFLGGWLGFVAPLIAFVTKGKESPTVRAHSVAALNFQLTWIGVSVVLSVVLCCGTVVTLGLGAVGYVLLAVPWLIATIFGVIAGVRANDGGLYRYPMSISIIK